MGADIKSMSSESLKGLRDSITKELKARRTADLGAEREAKAERETKFKGNVKEKDLIRFFFNRKETEAEVQRVSEKSVTVEVDGSKKYIKYENILNILNVKDEAKADEAKDETEVDETEVDEAEDETEAEDEDETEDAEAEAV